ncbi:FxsA family protein [Alteromonas sp. S015]|uniref:FxsA family protein n=1 Tax=Alteromonas sp. S015 TaxID=3117401 RepID=UPI002FE306FC
MRVLFVLFALLPILEIALLINVGNVIGGWNTVGLVILSAFIGAYFVKREGVSTLQTAQEKMQRNEVPGKELVEGLMLVVAGILLVTPGFITDIFGFLLAMPGSRHFFVAQVSKHMKMRVVMSGAGAGGAGPSAGGFNTNGQQSPFGSDPFGNSDSPFNTSAKNKDDVIEGEYTDNTQNDEDKRLK